MSVPAAIQFHGQSPEYDWPQARRGQERHACAGATGAGDLLRYPRQAIGKLTGLDQVCPDSPEWYAKWQRSGYRRATRKI